MGARVDAVRAAMAGDGLDAVLVAAPANLAYLTGWRPTPYERLIALVLPREGEPRLVVPSLEEESAAAAVAGAELAVWRDEDGPAAALADALRGCGTRIGIEKRYLTVEFFELAREAAREAMFSGCDELIGRLRAVKDEDELEHLRRAAAIVDAALVRLAAEELRPGRTEAELAADYGRILREEGGEGLGFEPIVLAGAKSALPHGSPDLNALAVGDLVIVDVGAVSGGYCADITRTFVVGREPDERQRELHDVVLRAHDAAVAAAVAGTPCRDVDRAARTVIEEAGYGAGFVTRTGHGLGLEVHEPPYLSSSNEQPLEPGNVVTIEPGIYLAGYGGLRIEDDVVVTSGGAEVLTRTGSGLVPPRS